ncbi:MAG: bifunctional [glutamine synthetase] adenylyltransferase/[glutamine synthetase]-adenylyl-L-tyrosine phosphorylase, partial [Roseiarcus sp.]
MEFPLPVVYQSSEAETWERMALTRSRVVAGEPSLSREIAAAIAAVLTVPREAEKLAGDARAMRKLIASEKSDKDPSDLKLVSGGLIDIEFVAQYLVLAHARRHPGLLETSTRAVIAEAGAAG